MSGWEFYPKPNGRWYWSHADDDGMKVESTDGFDSHSDCLADAREHGYSTGSESYERPQNLPS